MTTCVFLINLKEETLMKQKTQTLKMRKQTKFIIHSTIHNQVSYNTHKVMILVQKFSVSFNVDNSTAVEQNYIIK